MPVIRDISYPQQPVGAYEKFEITFQLDATYTNPFDPDDIRVDGHFIYPDGREATVPAFYFIPYESVNGKTLLNYQTNLYRQTGEPAWKIRFASGLEGEYRFHITALTGMDAEPGRCEHLRLCRQNVFQPAYRFGVGQRVPAGGTDEFEDHFDAG